MTLRHALRALLRAPGYALMTIATLCVVIGANTAMFGVLHAVLLRELPYRDPGRLVEVGPGSVAFPEWERWREHARSFESMAVHFQNTGVARVTLTLPGGEPETMKAGFVSASFFETLGVAPLRGRVFTAEEERQALPVAVLSELLWRRQPGDKVTLNGVPHAVIGVMPATFAYPDRDAMAWVPLTTNRSWSRRAGPLPFFRVIGRLGPEVTPARAEAELRALGAGRVTVTSFRPVLAGNLRTSLYLLTGAVGFLLLLACANIANLTLARGTTRRAELALRVALGGSRARVAAGMFVESLLLAAVGVGWGLLLGSTALEVLIRFAPPGLPRLEEAGIDGAVAAFSVAATFAAAVLFGWVPAWQAARRDPVEAMRGGSRSASSDAAVGRWRGGLVVAEAALAVILLAGAGLLLRSFQAARDVELGFDPQRALIVRVLFPDGTPQLRRVTYWREAFERLESMPGVTAAGAIGDLFTFTGGTTRGLRAVEGQAPEPPERWTTLQWETVGGRFFEAMGATLVHGRWFRESDDAGTPLVAMIDEAMARRYWPGLDPIGRRFKGHDERGRGDEWLTVIGVVKNMRRQGLEREPTAQVFEWYRQASAAPRYAVVRTAGDPAGLRGNVRGALRSLDATAILSVPQTMEEELETQMAGRRFQTTLLGGFAAVGLLLAAIGIFGVVNYSVAARYREFGIRMALGETAESLRRRVTTEALRLAVPGIAAGVGVAAALAALLRSVLYGVSPFDPLTLAGAAGVLLVVVMAASLAPAVRAGRVEPLRALRED